MHHDIFIASSVSDFRVKGCRGVIHSDLLLLSLVFHARCTTRPDRRSFDRPCGCSNDQHSGENRIAHVAQVVLDANSFGRGASDTIACFERHLHRSKCYFYYLCHGGRRWPSYGSCDVLLYLEYLERVVMARKRITGSCWNVLVHVSRYDDVTRRMNEFCAL